MNITPEYIIERKRKNTQLLTWKLISILLIAIIVFVAGRNFLVKETLSIGDANEGYIASILIDGVIVEDEARDKKLKKIINDKKIKALIVNVNSPGGTVVGSEKIYNIFRKISQEKPIVIVMGTLAASGGYLISLGGDYIISHNGTITGSIGVILQTAEITDLAERLGIKFNNFKSGVFKASPNPTEKITEEVRQAVMEHVGDTYNYFIELVSLRRGIPLEVVKELADGRVYSGRQALKFKLVDSIGSEDTALTWLQNTKKIDPKLKVKEYKLKPKRQFYDFFLDDLDSLIKGFIGNNFHVLKSIL